MNDNNKEMETDDSSGEDMEIAEENSNSKKKPELPKVYMPGDHLQKNEVLTCDKSAYVILHQAQTGAPSLSFDIIENPFMPASSDYPMSLYLVAGTQSEETLSNSIVVLQMSNLHPLKRSDDSDDSEEESSDEDSDDESPQLSADLTRHLGCVNRIRSVVHEDVILAASWSELGKVHIWDITPQLKVSDPKQIEGKRKSPLFSFKGHQAEGYGLDWSSTKKGMLASGDCKSGLHIWHPAEDGTWQIDQRPLVGHSESVEDIQWSPNEPNVLTTCSVDKSIRIWDIRSSPSKANKLTVENAHSMDVNVINWNRNEPYIVSGGDDGIINIWDLRQFKSGSSVATFKHHSAPITTVEWHPEDPSVFASGGADNQIALWDIAVEVDGEDMSEEIENLPTQLLFIHQGQNEIKELHWHPKYSGVIISTALSGFNIFKTISV